MKTPQGDDCIAFKRTGELGTLIMKQARGSWQRKVLETLLEEGYIVGYQATGAPLRGKAKNYQSSYQRSLHNLMDRVTQVMLDCTPYYLAHDRVGPKGAFGYYITSV